MMLAAHQPNFFPWLGFFNKIHRADVFILLDDVQMVKTGSTWFNRASFLINGESRFVTVPVSRPSGTVLIKDAMICDDKWKKKLISTFTMTFKNHPYYRENIDPILHLIEINSGNLAELNLSVIRHFIDLFNLNETKIHLSSKAHLSSTSTQRLIDLVKRHHCDTYLEGGGASGYQEDDLFHSQNVSLIKQNFVHPKYPQKGSSDFVMGLSILDALFNCGKEETSKLIKNHT